MSEYNKPQRLARAGLNGRLSNEGVEKYFKGLEHVGKMNEKQQAALMKKQAIWSMVWLATLVILSFNVVMVLLLLVVYVMWFILGYMRFIKNWRIFGYKRLKLHRLLLIRIIIVVPIALAARVIAFWLLNINW